MQKDILVNFFERDLERLAQELELFQNEQNIWRTVGAINNSCGNLTLHIIGGTHALIGNQLGKTGYERNRNEEFAKKDVPRATLVTQIRDLIPLVRNIVSAVDVGASYPIPFDDATRTNGYVLTQLALHLNYHLGQVNYLRRVLDS